MARSLKLFIGLFFATILVAILLYCYYIFHQLSKPMLLSQTTPVIIEVKPNSSAYELINNLYTQKLIESKSLFLKVIHYQNLANQIKAGVYQVKVGESGIQFLNRVIKGDVLILPFRIVEGTSLKQIHENLVKAPYLYYQNSDWQTIQQQPGNAEGLLLADTYQYHAGSSAKELLRQAHKDLQNVLEKNWQTRDANLPYRSSYELLIAASILEKETALANERKIIAGIIVNRLQKNMRLQMDPTVIYALGPQYLGKLHHHNLSIDSPYNTYRYTGLPPTPIAMVGKESIEAAAHPLRTQYLYFVAKGDGSHAFSATYTEQKKAIRDYMQRKKD